MAHHSQHYASDGMLATAQMLTMQTVRPDQINRPTKKTLLHSHSRFFRLALAMRGNRSTSSELSQGHGAEALIDSDEEQSCGSTGVTTPQALEVPTPLPVHHQRFWSSTTRGLLHQMALYDRLCAVEVAHGIIVDKDDIECAMIEAIPRLERVGMFDLFCADDWLTSSSAGRRFVGARAKRRGL